MDHDIGSCWPHFYSKKIYFDSFSADCTNSSTKLMECKTMTDYEESDNFQKKFLGNGTANALMFLLDGKSPGPTT